MSDTKMKNVGQTQPAKKPAKDQISSADQRSSPRSPISWREIRTTQQVENNDRIACQTVNFHDSSGPRIQPEIGVSFNKKLFSHSCPEFKPRAVRAQALASVACGGACASVLTFRNPGLIPHVCQRQGGSRERNRQHAQHAVPHRFDEQKCSRRPRRFNERDSSRVSGVGPVGDRVVQPGQSFGFADGRLAPRFHATQVVPTTGKFEHEQTGNREETEILCYLCFLTNSEPVTPPHIDIYVKSDNLIL